MNCRGKGRPRPLLKSEKQLFFVIGMHRSGTSCIAGILTKAFGATAFPFGKGLPTGHPNPTGYFESKNVMTLNDKIMAEWGMAWDNVFGSDRPVSDIAKSQVKALLHNDYYDNHDISVIKDPRLCVTMPAWENAAQEIWGFDNVHFVFVIRKPDEVVKSWERLYPDHKFDKKMLYAYYNYYLMNFMERLQAGGFSFYVIDFSYGSQVEHNYFGMEIERIASETNIPIINRTALDFFDPKHKHF